MLVGETGRLYHSQRGLTIPAASVGGDSRQIASGYLLVLDELPHTTPVGARGRLEFCAKLSRPAAQANWGQNEREPSGTGPAPEQAIGAGLAGPLLCSSLQVLLEVASAMAAMAASTAVRWSAVHEP